MTVIELTSVSKRFELHPDRPRSLQELFLRRLHREKDPGSTTLWALRDVSLSVGAGETVGLIGSNGSGKSTCLKLMTRILTPTSGTVQINGRVSALLELGAGFHPELTGRENILLNGSVLGVPRREMLARFDEIVAFAELERFIDVPVKVYSSGMYVRLAFATAISVSPEILLVDEVLAVGDQSFQEKCLDRIQRLKQEGVTIVIVSHDLDSIGALCDRVVWLNEGRLAEDGRAEDVLGQYLAHVYHHDHPIADESREDVFEQSDGLNAASDAAGDNGPHVADGSDATAELIAEPAADAEPTGLEPERWGTGRVKVTEVVLLDDQGRPADQFVTGEGGEIAVHYVAEERIETPAFGVAIHRADGVHISGCNTAMSGQTLAALEGAGVIRYQIEQLPLLPGEYLLSVAVHDVQETESYDYLSYYYPFRVVQGESCPHQGLIHIPAHWRHEPHATGDGGEA